MRSYKLIFCLENLSNVELSHEIEVLLSYSVPMSLGTEPRQIRYVHYFKSYVKARSNFFKIFIYNVS